MKIWKEFSREPISKRRARRNVLLTLGAVSFVGAFYFLFMKWTGLSIPCLIYEQTGLLCPGCGVTHMAEALAGGRFLEAFFYNPAVMILLILWIVAAVLMVIGKPSAVRRPIFLYGALFVSVSSMVFWGIFRNIS